MFASILLLMPETKLSADSQATQADASARVFHVFCNTASVWAFLLQGTCSVAGFMGVLTNMPYLLESGRSLTVMTSSWILMLMAVSGLTAAAANAALLHLGVKASINLKIGLLMHFLAGIAILYMGCTADVHKIALPVLLTPPFIFGAAMSFIMAPARAFYVQPFGDAAGTAMGCYKLVEGGMSAFINFGFTLLLESSFNKWMAGVGVVALVLHAVSWPLMVWYLPEDEKSDHDKPEHGKLEHEKPEHKDVSG